MGLCTGGHWEHIVHNGKIKQFFLACEKPQDKIKKKKEVTPKQVVQTHFSFPGFQTKKNLSNSSV